MGHCSSTWLLNLKWLEIWKEEQKRIVRLSKIFEIRFCMKISNSFVNRCFWWIFQKNLKFPKKYIAKKLVSRILHFYSSFWFCNHFENSLVKELWHKTYQVKKWGETEKWSHYYSVLGHCSTTKVLIFKMVTESERGVKMQNPALWLFCNLIFFGNFRIFLKNLAKTLIFKRIQKFHKNRI